MHVARFLSISIVFFLSFNYFTLILIILNYLNCFNYLHAILFFQSLRVVPRVAPGLLRVAPGCPGCPGLAPAWPRVAPDCVLMRCSDLCKTEVEEYSNNLFYNINTQLFGTSPLGSIAGSVVPNANLRPMRVSEKEAGLELKLFDYRLGIDISYYDKLSSDQILRKQASNAGGFLTELVNVGESRNQGVEILLDVS